MLLTAGKGIPLSDNVSEEDIKNLVQHFYAAAQTDALLGPVFQTEVADWDAHLEKMGDFWSSVVLRTGRYAGRPIQAHQTISGLTEAHFARWLVLFEASVHTTIHEEAAPLFLEGAERMGRSMTKILEVPTLTDEEKSRGAAACGCRKCG
jgi:hemoglobin